MSCNGTPMIFQTGARKLEGGKNGVNQSGGWGDVDSPQDLGANNGIPWLSMELNEDYDFKRDTSVVSSAFSVSERLMHIALSKNLSFLDRYYGQDDLNYWMFGFENGVKPVIAFKTAASPFDTTPAAGDIFEDGTPDEYVFLRKETARIPETNTAVDIYVFQNDGTAVPPDSGQLTEKAPGTNTFDYTSISGQMYEHLFELDKNNRNLRDFTAAEQAVLTTGDATGWESGDKRNIMLTMGKKYLTYDVKVQNLMCKSFKWGLVAGTDGEGTYEVEFVGYKKEEGDFSSSTWTMQSGGNTQDNSPAHYETHLYLGTTPHDENGDSGDMIQVDPSECNVTVNIPVDESQSFVSGLFTNCPILNAQYEIMWDAILSRHDTLLYQTRLRAQTKMVARIQSTQGWFMKEFIIKKSTLKQAGADNEPIAKEPLEGSVDFIETNPWASWMHGITETQGSPLVMRVRNENALNSMFLY